MLWLAEGKTVAEVSKLQHRIPETIRLQRRHWELYQFESIKEGARSGRPSSISVEYQQIMTQHNKVHSITAIRSKRINVMGCLLSIGQLITSCLKESVTSTWFYAYLLGVAQRVRQAHNIPLILIVDNASIHRHKKMMAFLEMVKSDYSTNLYFIPAYSPKLNRI